MNKEARKYLEILGLDYISVDTVVKELNIPQRQLIEIAKAISINPSIIIMDEPTSSLTISETEYLMKLILKMRNTNVAILYISHRMNEVFEIADKISVLRDGHLVGTFDKNLINASEITEKMVGRELGNQTYEINKNITDEAVLSVRNLCYRKKVRNISFDLYKGKAS